MQLLGDFKNIRLQTTNRKALHAEVFQRLYESCKQVEACRRTEVGCVPLRKLMLHQFLCFLALGPKHWNLIQVNPISVVRIRLGHAFLPQSSIVRFNNKCLQEEFDLCSQLNWIQHITNTVLGIFYKDCCQQTTSLSQCFNILSKCKQNE